MRRPITALALLLAVLLVPMGSTSAAPEEAARVEGKTIRFKAWGPLGLGMTHRQAWGTGMVSHQRDRCMPGYQMTVPYRDRGFVVWKGDGTPYRVQYIVIRGKLDRTARGIGVGSTLRQLRAAYPKNSGIRSRASIDHQVPSRRDVWVVTKQMNKGVITFQFPHGLRPGPRAKIDTIVIARKPVVWMGC